ncbi:thiopeptide-type bacteriocin biosynthesis protein, partial [Streptomyces sp. T-3]|nr:thiopeptide-type bacteriocin biosynthesis protein [Streptomyces sp. T-3]
LRDAARSTPAAWQEALADWRRRLRVPDRLQLAQNDQMYPLDLRDAWDQELLRAELRAAQPRFMLYEDLTADGAGLGWNRGHSTEIVVPLVRSARHLPDREAPRKPAPPIRPAPSLIHLPGENWLFAKIYADPTTHDALITDHIPRLLTELDGDVDRWFFLRYRDPDPHLRLRLHGRPEDLNSRVLPALTRHVRNWITSGAVRTMSLDVYRPESDRYGGPELQEAAERIFATDSLSALLSLRARRSAPDLPDDVLAALGHAVLLESLGPWDWCAWVQRMLSKGPEHEAYQRHRVAADRLIRPGEVIESAAQALACPSLTELWASSPEPSAYGRLILAAPAADRDEAVFSLLHMHHNRHFGIDPAAEARGYAVLRGAVRTHLGRQAHHTVPTPPHGSSQ